LIGPNIEATEAVPIYINGKKIIAGTSSDRFDCVNILGMDYIIDLKHLRYDLLGINKMNPIIEFWKTMIFITNQTISSFYFLLNKIIMLTLNTKNFKCNQNDWQ